MLAPLLLANILTSILGSDVVNVGVLLPSTGDYPWVIQKTLPALEIAIERLNKNTHLLPNHLLHLVVKDSQCSGKEGPLEAIELYRQNHAHVFIGPACDYAVAPVARYSQRWGIPVLTAGALVSAFLDKSEYNLLTRMVGPYNKLGDFVLDILRHFKWQHVGLLYSDFKYGANKGKSNCFFQLEAIYLELKKSFRTKPWHKSFSSTIGDDQLKALLQEAMEETRVILLCAPHDTVRNIMIQFEELGLDNGEYVVINFDMFSSGIEGTKPWFRAGDTTQRNRQARKAYEAVMTVTHRRPSSAEFAMFSKEVKRRGSALYHDYVYGEEEVNLFVGAFHDAVMLYAFGLHETLASGGNVSDGAAITSRMWNRTFQGISGTVSIDANGDRDSDYSLLDLHPGTGRLEVVANYFGNIKQYEPVHGKRIHWAGGRTSPPPDVPKCGFHGAKCPPDERFPDYGIVIIVLGSVVLVVLVAAFLIYRWKFSNYFAMTHST
ncbi:atrial natriuretic peptide receptor 1-like [Haliotis rufescens]|uniref:atrial natriuretic peptide receptor 1-like n=1 Tax=Haliotis rufescens TaxID=6454 RepID=UPI00201EAAD7|nr:atrial natriuretic peptide receptor 1-like [Haliotis rufescens]XP_048251034.1 atrial natriuretic peptide receptor 1-like [Haliotis rufescens]XP_048251035.1 atrial natriuretic peptide receptor 1-like [Haliotis rufescens]XP_048251036.1 atrial natriuretic peptide receptor 1-like [Haliotis rufescens]